MLYDFEMLQRFYDHFAGKVDFAREQIKRPMTLTEKILYAHLDYAEPITVYQRGIDYVNFRPDRVAMQDATAQMALLQFMNAGKDKSAVPTSVHCDHLIVADRGAKVDLAAATENNREVYEFLRTVSNAYGIGFWKPGAGIIHQVVLENYAFPGGMMIGTDSHTPNAGGLGMVAIGVGGADASDARSVLELYNFDSNPDDTSPENLMRQSVQLISKFPTIIAYAFNILRHSTHGLSLHIRHPAENLTIAENFLYMLKRYYTSLEARTLDLVLVLQAEHGGGNNSTFSVRVTSSTGTDTYSSIAAGIGSLKGPLHGGANHQVVDMFNHLKENISDWKNVKEIDKYFERMLNKEVYNKTGLIYGIGHAVYTISDPRAILLKELARDLAKEKGRQEEFAFLELLEERAIQAFYTFKGNKKSVSSNIDFYSGFVYEMIGLPEEIYTPLFAMARIVGWTAHRIEELNFKSKRIIRPAYRNILETQTYIPIKNR